MCACWQSHYIIDSSEPYALPLTDASLSRVLASHCRGWRHAVKFSAMPCLQKSLFRQMSCVTAIQDGAEGTGVNPYESTPCSAMQD